MTEKEFDVFVDIVIPERLFHVSKQDIDDRSGGKLDEVILIELIASNIGCLKHKPLQWFLQTFL